MGFDVINDVAQGNVIVSIGAVKSDWRMLANSIFTSVAGNNNKGCYHPPKKQPWGSGPRALIKLYQYHHYCKLAKPISKIHGN